MSLTGLFLVIFLLVHLAGNSQLLLSDSGESFNLFTSFMTHNPVIELIAWVLYICILLHAIQGLLIWRENRIARPKRYAVSTFPNTAFMSRQMILLGLLVFAFLCLHMGDFWVKMKFTDVLGMKLYAGASHEVVDLYSRVAIAFKQEWIVGVYIIGTLSLGLHLWHGFDSAFQTLGLRHMRFGYLFKPIGMIYTVVVTFGFTIIPLYMYFLR